MYRITSAESTEGFHFIGWILSIIERWAFTALTIAVLSSGDPADAQSFPLGSATKSDFQTIAITAGGWVALKTLVGWRRIQNPTPPELTLSQIGVHGGILSVSLGILAGVLTLVMKFD